MHYPLPIGILWALCIIWTSLSTLVSKRNLSSLTYIWKVQLKRDFTQPWNRFLEEAVKSPSLEILRTKLSNLLTPKSDPAWKLVLLWGDREKLVEQMTFRDSLQPIFLFLMYWLKAGSCFCGPVNLLFVKYISEHFLSGWFCFVAPVCIEGWNLISWWLQKNYNSNNIYK